MYINTPMMIGKYCVADSQVKDHTAVYRWRLVPGSPAHFVPTDDNLPMKAQ